MPIPVSPVCPTQPEMLQYEIVIAKDQPQYIPLPAVVSGDGLVVTRWRFSFWERWSILITGNLWHSQMCFSEKPHPIRIQTDEPQFQELILP